MTTIKIKWVGFFTLLILTTVILGFSSAQSVSADAATSAGTPQTVISQSQMSGLGFTQFDSSFGIISTGSGNYNYIGTPFNTSVVSKKFSGTATAISSTSSVTINNVPSPYVAWIVNTYKDPGTGHILAIVHLENACCDYHTRYRLALAYSKDGGSTFNFLGIVVAPKITDTQVLALSGPKGTNVGGGGYIIKNGELWLYYADTDVPFDPAKNAVLAVAKASLSSIINAGENNTALPNFYKYYNGSWNESGIGGNFTQLDPDVFGGHLDITYNSYLGQYMYTNNSSAGLSLKISSDPLNWNVPMHTIHHNSTDFDFYPTIAGTGSDTRDTGQSFYVYYATNNLHQYDRVQVTVNGSGASMINNAGFESSLTSWINWGNLSNESSIVHSGSSAAKVGTSGGGGEQTITGITAGQTYTLSGWGKLGASGQTGATVAIHFKNAAGQFINTNSEAALTWSETAYTQKSTNVVAPAGATQAQVYMWKDSGSSYFYVDDLFLQLNKVVNPGFESTLNSWINWGNLSNDSANMYSGSSTAKIGIAGGGGEQNVTGITEGITYTLSGWGKLGASGETGAKLAIHFKNAAGQFINANSEATLTWTETAYTLKSTIVTAPTGATQAQVWMWKDSGSSYFYVDDVSLN